MEKLAVSHSLASWAGQDRVWVNEDFLSHGQPKYTLAHGHAHDTLTVSLMEADRKAKTSSIELHSYDADRLHSHEDFLEIFYVYSGKGIAFIDGCAYVLQKGDLVCIQKGQIHANYPLEDLMIYNCILSESLLDATDYCFSELEAGFTHLSGKSLLRVESLFKALFEERARGEHYYEAAMISLANQLFIELLRFRRENQAELRQHEKIAVILNYLSEHYRTVSLTELAEVAAYNPNYLSRLFRERFDLTFTDYVNRLRISQAIRLLDESDLTVEEIAENVGFGSRIHFYKVFKKHCGMTPAALRKKKR